MKENICTAAGVIGGFFAALLGGWDSALATLIIFMAIDFTTGLITASMGRSKHSKTGKLSSKAGWVGLAKKFCILLMVVVAVRMNIMIGTTYIRDLLLRSGRTADFLQGGLLQGSGCRVQGHCKYYRRLPVHTR